ncbi:MAG: NAD(P)-dependent alcohol dehydrogenase [Chloroflexota bacterium]
MNQSKEMNAVVCTAYGEPDVLQMQTVQKPMPKDDEVLIRNHATVATAASLNGRKGTPAFIRLFTGIRAPKRNILGQEIVGIVEAVGKDIKAFQVGDHVMAMTSLSMGAYAEYVCVAETDALAHKPANMSFEDAVAIIEGGLTAINFLKNQAQLKRGQCVLVYGASGSVGTASIQIAKHFGAEVTGVCSSRNVELVQSLGADHVIDYTKEDFTKNGKSYDVIFDTVGKRSYWQCRSSLTDNGVYLDAAGLGTVLAMLLTRFSSKKAILSATYMRSKSDVAQDLRLLKEIAEKGNIQAVIDKRFPLAEMAQAHRYVETGRKRGNLVVNIA